MVLIVSEQVDTSTSYVIDWLDYYQQKFLRINRDEFISNRRPHFKVEIDSATSAFSLGSDDIQHEIRSVWFRRSIYSFLPYDLSPRLNNNSIQANFTESFYYEYQNSSLLFYMCLEKDKKVLGNFRKWRLNKIDILTIAKANGLDIPATLVANKKQDVVNFMLKRGAIITKALSEVFDITVKAGDNSEVYMNYTEEITWDVVENLPDSFFYSLFQEKLNKDIEIRTFFIKGHCYSMAIFSQADAQTSVDFRKYSNNRNVPFQLPSSLESKISSLMEDIGLDTGSLDFVRTTDGRFVFLEVNPTGQYGMTSDPCNYYLDKIIAEYLIVDDTE